MQGESGVRMHASRARINIAQQQENRRENIDSATCIPLLEANDCSPLLCIAFMAANDTRCVDGLARSSGER